MPTQQTDRFSQRRQVYLRIFQEISPKVTHWGDKPIPLRKPRLLERASACPQWTDISVKLSRIAGAGAVAALVAASTLLGAGAAQAAIINAPSITIDNETDPYGTGWFSGDGTTGTATQTPAGIVIDGTFQLLNGTPNATDLVALANSARVHASGAAYLQIPVFGEPNAIAPTDKEFTTLRPADPAAYTASDLWVTSRAIPGYGAQDQATLADFATALAGGSETYEILAFGVFINAGETVTLHSLGWSGNTYNFATSTMSLSSKSISAADAASKGVTITLSGFVPGSLIEIGLGYGMSGGPVDTVTADANGSATFVHKFVGDPKLGEYTLSAILYDSDLVLQDTFTVVANTLPEAGVDAAGIALLAGALLLAGTGAFLLRRRTAVQ